MIDIKITNALILTIDSHFTMIEDGCICIEKDTIVKIGTTDECSLIEAETVINAQGNLVMPGLINAHTHAAMSIYRGMADDLPLQEWLDDFIFPTEAEFCTAENVAVGTQLAILEMIQSGTTCFADMYYFQEISAKICTEMGIRAVLGQALIDFPAPDHKTSESGLTYTKNLLNQYKNNSLVSFVPAPHSPYTCQDKLLLESRKLANEYNVPLHIHLSETIAEYNQSLSEFNKTPVQYLNDLGIFEGKTIAAHCVYISNEDREILAKKNVGVINNPQSNLKLVSGISPVPLLLEAGINVGLGTDSAVSNNTLDMFQEMKVASLIHKLNQSDASTLPAKDVVYMATLGSAKCLGIDAITGSLEVGKKADVIIVNINQPHLVPLYNIYSQIVFAIQGHDVDTVIINGKLVLIQKQFQDIDYIQPMIDAQKIANQILSKQR
jgi:5-methylthioadenosine/S-adenosylhomocysteine deaminase